MKLGVLFSGGKDSCLALHKAIKDGHEIKCLLSIVPETADSWMFHKSDLRLLKRQARELGIELVIVKSKGEKEKELEDLEKIIEKAIKKYKITGICVGGIASSYQGTRVKNICDNLGLEFYAPLLDYSADKLWDELIDNKFKVIMTKISCEGIDKEFIGKIIDDKLLEELKKKAEKFKFRLDFEGGEAETAVLFMPEFKHEIKLDFSIESEGSFRHFLRIKSIK